MYCHNLPAVLTCVKDTMVLVTEVPMLEPMIIGMASCTSKTENMKNDLHATDYNCQNKSYGSTSLPIFVLSSGDPLLVRFKLLATLMLGDLLPADTMDTMMEVEVEEDCTSTVTRMPIIRPTTGFWMYWLDMMSPATQKVMIKWMDGAKVQVVYLVPIRHTYYNTACAWKGYQ